MGDTELHPTVGLNGAYMQGLLYGWIALIVLAALFASVGLGVLIAMLFYRKK
jgi:hypothetical protein